MQHVEIIQLSQDVQVSDGGPLIRKIPLKINRLWTCLFDLYVLPPVLFRKNKTKWSVNGKFRVAQVKEARKGF